MANMGSRCAG